MRVRAQTQQARPQSKTSHAVERPRVSPRAHGHAVESIRTPPDADRNRAALLSLRDDARDFSRIPIHSDTPVRLQAKLAVNTPGDVYEREADRVAEEVMRTHGAARRPARGEGCAECGREQLQAKSAGAGGPAGAEVPHSVGEVLGSPGRPLDTGARAFMESRFGYDFGAVRVHTDARAAESARAVNALAYTVGHNVVFQSGLYSPGTEAGRRLLAHELTHVVQQRAGAARGAAPGVTPAARQVQRQVPPRRDAQTQPVPTQESSADEDTLRRLREEIGRAEQALRRTDLTGTARAGLQEALTRARSAESRLREQAASEAPEMVEASVAGTAAFPASVPRAAEVIRGRLVVGASGVAAGMLTLLASMLTSGWTNEDFAAQAIAEAEAAELLLRGQLQRVSPFSPPVTLPNAPPVPNVPPAGIQQPTPTVTIPPAIPRPAPPVVTDVPPMAHRPYADVTRIRRRPTTRRRPCDCWCFDQFIGDGVELPYKYPARCALAGIPPLTTPQALQRPELCSHWCRNVPPQDMATYLQMYGYGQQRFMRPPFRYFSCGPGRNSQTPRTRWRRFLTVGSPLRP